MKLKTLWLLAFLSILSSGCTTVALHYNTSNQEKTISDILADQTLYNLALYEDYYDGKRVNGIPCFIQMNNGLSQVTDNIGGTAAFGFASAGNTETPSVTGGHSVADNWAFTAITDPNQISRLFWIYRSQFNVINNSNDLARIFPTPPQYDQTGHPFLIYQLTITNNMVQQTNGQPVYTVTTNTPSPHHLNEVPGAYFCTDGITNIPDGWFSTVKPPGTKQYPRMGPYLGVHYFYITNSDNFFKFVVLTLGGTNNMTFGPSAPGSTSPLFIIQNGQGRFQ